MLTFIDNADKNHDFSQFKLIVPAVSVGNVGQLTVDLLISTLNLTKVGYIRHRNIIPVVASGSNGMVTECELYASKELKIAVIQIRSTYGPFNSISKFFSSLCKSFQSVVILTGSYAYERKNIHLVAEPIYYLTTNAFVNSKIPLPENWKKLEEFVISPTSTKIPGSGIADHLFDLCNAESIPAVLIANFVSEGDNRGDAFAMANFMDSWLKLKSGTQWKPPAVWQTLFGNPIPLNLF